MKSVNSFSIQKAIAYRKLRKAQKLFCTKFENKILYKMAWDRNPYLRIFADKFKVRKYIEKLVGPNYLVDVLGVFEKPSNINWEGLPEEFVVKVNHGSGGDIVVSNKAPSENLLPEPPVGWARFFVQPNNFNSESAVLLLNYWLGLDYEWWAGRNPEWAYKKIERKVIIEELIHEFDSESLKEYKVFCINSVPEFIRVCQGSVSDNKEYAQYDTEWRPLNFIFIEAGSRNKQLLIEPKPVFLSELLTTSSILSSKSDFLRVDFMWNGKKLKVGELTNYPTAGNLSFDPEGYSYAIGQSWIPKYRKLNEKIRNFIIKFHFYINNPF